MQADVVESNEYGLGAILKSKLLSKQFTSDDRYPVRVFPILGVLSKELAVKLAWIWVVTRLGVPSIEVLC